MSEIKEELQKKEQLKEAAKKKQELRDDVAAKKRIRDKIEADKEERRRKAEQEKLARQGEMPQQTAPAVVPMPGAGGPSASKAAGQYTEARLRLQTPQGNVQKSFGIETTLFEVAEAVKGEKGIEVQAFETTFPRKKFEREDWGMTLKEAGMVPSAVVIVK